MTWSSNFDFEMLSFVSEPHPMADMSWWWVLYDEILRTRVISCWKKKKFGESSITIIVSPSPAFVHKLPVYDGLPWNASLGPSNFATPCPPPPPPPMLLQDAFCSLFFTRASAALCTSLHSRLTHDEWAKVHSISDTVTFPIFFTRFLFPVNSCWKLFFYSIWCSTLFISACCSRARLCAVTVPPSFPDQFMLKVVLQVQPSYDPS